MKEWEKIYKDKGVVQEKPSQQIIELVPLFKEYGVKKILDHGCGTGRHVKYLAQQDFSVVGTDNSRKAIEIVEKNLGNLQAKLICCDMSEIPYEDGHFDAIISSQVIQHALVDKREAAISEMKRTLKPDGFLFIRTISRKQKVFGLGKEVEPFTFINVPGLPDGKNPHHYFSKEELESYFRGFEILRLEEKSHLPRENDLWQYGLEELVLLARKRNK